MESLHGLLGEDLYAALPNLKPHAVTKSRHRSHRGFNVLLSSLPDLIILTVKSINSYFEGCKEKHIVHAVTVFETRSYDDQE